MMTLTAKIIDTVAELELLSVEWESLLTRVMTYTTFQSPAFMLAWLKTLGQNHPLRVITWRDDKNRLVGLAPLCLTPAGAIEFIGGKDVSDYLDFIIDPDYSDVIYQQLGQKLLAWSVKKINLHSIPASSITWQLLPKIWSDLTAKSTSWKVVVQDVCPIISLPATWEEYLSQIERKQRHEIRRKWRKLESLAKIEFVTVTKSQDLDWAVTEFIRLHKLSSRDKAKFWIPGMAEFFSQFMLALAHKNQLRLTFLKIKDLNLEAELDFPDHTAVATMLGFVSGQKYLLYNSGFDPNYATLSTGQVLTSYTIKTAIEAGMTDYDFMRGREEYKFRLGGQPTEVFDLTLSR